jgi:MYXO-CTERM domain-containing protein
MKISRLILTGATALLFGSIAQADLIPGGTVNVSGAGFGDVNTILTFQSTGQGMGSSESGCVGVSSSGVLNTTGSSVCQGGNSGGDEKAPAGFPHNQTFMVGNASQIGLVFNAAQPGGGPITINNLTLALFNSSGTVGFTSGAFTPITLNSTQPGIGNAGFLFTLDATQAAAAQAAINGGFDLLGLSATTSPGLGGPETFFLANTPDENSVPESSTLSSVGVGLLGLALIAAMRRPTRMQQS